MDGDEILTIDDSSSVMCTVLNKVNNKFTQEYQNKIVRVQNPLANCYLKDDRVLANEYAILGLSRVYIWVQQLQVTGFIMRR